MTAWSVRVFVGCRGKHKNITRFFVLGPSFVLYSLHSVSRVEEAENINHRYQVSLLLCEGNSRLVSSRLVSLFSKQKQNRGPIKKTWYIYIYTGVHRTQYSCFHLEWFILLNHDLFKNCHGLCYRAYHVSTSTMKERLNSLNSLSGSHLLIMQK